MIEFIHDADDIRELIGDLKVFPGAMEKAVSRAINKSLVSVRAEMVRMVRADYAVRAAAVRGELGMIRATWSRLQGRIAGESSPGIPLIEFARTKKIPSTRRTKRGGYTPKKGIPVLIRKDKGRGPASGVFLARMQSGHADAFKRIDSMQGDWWQAKKGGRERIRIAFGPSPLKMLSADRYAIPLDDYGDEVMEKNLQHEAKYLLDKMRGTA